jgi:hypothetical protein
MKIKGHVLKAVASAIAVGLVCLGVGYYIGSGGTLPYATTREIRVNVRVEPKEGNAVTKTVKIRDGMSAFDALLKVADIQTKYWEAMETSTVVSIAGSTTDPMTEGYTYTVNGEMPPVAMTEYQLHDGDNLEVRYAKW